MAPKVMKSSRPEVFVARSSCLGESVLKTTHRQRVRWPPFIDISSSACFPDASLFTFCNSATKVPRSNFNETPAERNKLCRERRSWACEPFHFNIPTELMWHRGGGVVGYGGRWGEGLKHDGVA